MGESRDSENETFHDRSNHSQQSRQNMEEEQQNEQSKSLQEQYIIPNPPPSIEKLEECLQLNRVAFDKVITGDFERTWFHTHFAEDYQMEDDATEGTMTLDEWIDGVWAAMNANPGYTLQSTSETIDYDVSSGIATVWLFVRTGGMPEGTIRDGLGVFKWKLTTDNRWQCYYMSRLRSGFGFPFQLDQVHIDESATPYSRKGSSVRNGK